MFEWDTRKASANRDKHGVSFEEAASVFADPVALDGPDVGHSEQKSRYLRLGQAATGRVLMVAYTRMRLGDGETIRIISARRASRKERAAYRPAHQQD
ncbi:MAG: BrnT family toxin [Candidatus Rokuibacteriota bacterium]